MTREQLEKGNELEKEKERLENHLECFEILGCDHREDIAIIIRSTMPNNQIIINGSTEIAQEFLQKVKERDTKRLLEIEEELKAI